MAPETREVFLRELMQSCEPEDIPKMWSWAGGLGDPALRDSARADLCYKLAQTDPARAIQLANGSALGNTIPGLLENLVQQWSNNDPAAALRWSRSQPGGEPRDTLLARVAFALSQTDPVAAARLVACEITPGPIQDEAGVSVLQQWGQRDPVAALAWQQTFPPGPLRDRARGELPAEGN